MSFFNKLSKGVSEVGTKAKITYEITKLKGQIAKLNEEIQSYYKAIGETTYKNYNVVNSQLAEEIEQYIVKIKQVESLILATEQEIQTLSNEKVCSCGEVVPLDMKFCSHCGHQFPHESYTDHQNEQTVLLAEDMGQHCAKCAAPLPAKAAFCGECGHDIAPF